MTISVSSFIVGAVSAATLATLYSRITAPPLNTEPLSSPLDAYLNTLSQGTISRLPYPPSGFLPGARNVSSPYGKIRVYEFGPERAERRVVLLHGISTSSPALAAVAEQLAAHGCRVMLFDLFGRGWSGGPSDVPYDGRLYATQIFLALASSPLAWTGSDEAGRQRRFTLVGYSLGGALAADFASWFPNLVQDLVLIAPGGLIREKHISLRSKVMYSEGYLPERLLAWWLRRTLSTNEPATPPPADDEKTNVEAILDAEAPEAIHTGRSVDVNGTVAWQLATNEAFIPAFMSSIRHAPIRGRHSRWGLIGQRLDASRAHGPDKPSTPSIPTSSAEGALQSGAALLILGPEDSIIIEAEITADARAAMGEENVRFHAIEGAGHEVPMTHSREVVKAMLDFWQHGHQNKHDI